MSHVWIVFVRIVWAFAQTDKPGDAFILNFFAAHDSGFRLTTTLTILRIQLLAWDNPTENDHQN